MRSSRASTRQRPTISCTPPISVAPPRRAPGIAAPALRLVQVQRLCDRQYKYIERLPGHDRRAANDSQECKQDDFCRPPGYDKIKRRFAGVFHISWAAPSRMRQRRSPSTAAETHTSSAATQSSDFPTMPGAPQFTRITSEPQHRVRFGAQFDAEPSSRSRRISAERATISELASPGLRHLAQHLHRRRDGVDRIFR